MDTAHIPPFSFLKLHFHYTLQLHLGLSVVVFLPASLPMYWTARNINQITPHAYFWRLNLETGIPPHCALILCIMHITILNKTSRSLRLYSVATRTKLPLIIVFYTHMKPLKHRYLHDPPSEPLHSAPHTVCLYVPLYNINRLGFVAET
jgi:hypothetical protein